MFASLRCYVVHKTVTRELVRLVDGEFATLISAQPGFVSYEFLDGGGGETMTISVFREASQAEASRELVRRWSDERLQDFEFTVTEALRGEVLVTRGRPGSAPSARADTAGPFASVRRYRAGSGDIRELITTAGARFADRVEMLEGFIGYRSMDCGDGQLLSISVFQDQRTAAASDELALQFVRKQLKDVDLRRTDMIGGGHIVVSRVTEELPEPVQA
jgi:hypothetical protein